MSADDPNGPDPDAALASELAAAVERADPVPPAAVSAAKTLLGWRSIDDDLALLQFDSAESSGAVRGQATTRQLSFEATSASIEIELSEDGIIGQVVPPQAADVELRVVGGPPTTVTANALGQFSLPRPPSGAVHVRARLAEGAVSTAWFDV
jgi:hypothetical protein